MDAREHLLDHYENPRNKGVLAHPGCAHELSNPMCGDRIRVELVLQGDEQKIAEIAFDGKGCVISQAAASMLVEAVEGRPAAEVCALTGQFVLDMIGVPLTASRVKCALLGLETLKRALDCARPSLISSL